jgi:hypothetical protein
MQTYEFVGKYKEPAGFVLYSGNATHPSTDKKYFMNPSDKYVKLAGAWEGGPTKLYGFTYQGHWAADPFFAFNLNDDPKYFDSKETTAALKQQRWKEMDEEIEKRK